MTKQSKQPHTTYHILHTILIILFLVSTSFAIDVTFYKHVKMNKRQIEIGDGDTLIYKNIKIRVLGVDTPEVKNIKYGIHKNQYLGKEASKFTKKAIKKAKNIYYIPFKNDQYGRLLAHIVLDNDLLAVMLIKAGLGYETISKYGDNGFPKIAKEIQKTAKQSTKPNFQRPSIWRRKNQKK